MKRKHSDKSDKSVESSTVDASNAEVPGWDTATCVAFRFTFVYLGLFALATQIAGSLFAPGLSFHGLGELWPMREITFQVAQSVFGATLPLDSTGANGETIFFWSQTFWILVLAVLAAGAWSILDRGRVNYVAMHKWFRLFIRFGLAAQMFEYGITKIVPNQFAAPSLNILATPAGDLSLNTHFWTSMGASPGYQMFTGWAELLGGILLLVPRTTMVGALVCLVDMIHVFVLNITFDIGLKLTSFHLVLLTLFLLAPEFKRLADFFFFNRAANASSEPQLFSPLRTNRVALAAQIVFGVFLLGMQSWANVGYWYAEGGGAPRSPLYGIWNVEQLTVDGEVGPPSLNDYDRRWWRVVFDAPDNVAFQRTDDSFARYGASIDVVNNSITLTKGNSRNWESVFSFERPEEGRLVLDGAMDGYEIHVELRLVEFETFRLLNSHFRWIRSDGG
jgi:uncharacterized membrane protein YphA (DoxX/SURF4 family)